MRRYLWLALIFISGVSGLIYEVVWHRYLAILLGAQARATAVVLAIFLGGISLGYTYFGKWSRTKSWNLLRVYSFIELGLGLWAILFPFLFRFAQPLTSTFYAWFGIKSLFIDVFMSVLLIGFPTFLMGGTLPLLTQALAEDFQKASKTHAMIYGINTVGACFGCLIAGYFLIPTYGLIGAVQLAAGGNLVVALVSYFHLSRFASVRTVKEIKKQKLGKLTTVHKTLLLLGFLSGFYLLTLQTLLIRLMGLSTGSSNYNFTLIVSIFILGLGIGSLVVRRIDKYTASRLFFNQLAVVLALFVLYRTGGYWPYWVHVIRVLFRDSAEGFFPYQAVLGITFSAILLIPIGLAGLTLPLCFHLLKDDKDSLGHRVGQLYGLNSLGCVFGALIGGYYLYYFWNIDQLFKFCVYLSALGAVAAGFLVIDLKKISRGELWSSGVVLVALLVCTFVSPLYPKNRFIQPFRHASPIANVTYNGAEAFGSYLGRSTEYLYYKDGPNTTVGIGASVMEGKELSRTIIINGKSDGNTRGDYFTTAMLAHIPALLGQNIERACVIGFGTGTTIGLLANYDDIKDIQVAEISGTLIEHANLFDGYNGKVSQQAKVHFNEMDAFRFLEGTEKKFNMIVSEPSNPWVAGIENLYSHDFFELANRKLEPKGIFVQWIHTYSFDDQLFRMVLKTMGSTFQAVSVFQLRGGDYALVGTNEPFDRADLRRGEKRVKDNPKVQRSLEEAGVINFATILALEVVPFSLTRIMGEGSPIHRLESPLLSNAAAKAFFANSSANVDGLRKQFKEYYASVSDSLLVDYTNGKLANEQELQAFRQTFCDTSVSKNSVLCDETLAALKMKNPKFDPSRVYENVPSSRDLASLEQYTSLPKGKTFGPSDLQVVYDMFEVYKKFYSPIAYLPVDFILGRLDYCMKVSSHMDSMYGECLLEKILTFETARLRGAEFKASVSQYLTWFDTLPQAMPNYNKLLEARDILNKMIALEVD